MMWEYEDWRIDTVHWPGPRYTFDEWMEVNGDWMGPQFRTQLLAIDDIVRRVTHVYSTGGSVLGLGDLARPRRLVKTEVELEGKEEAEPTPADKLKARSTGPVRPPSWQQRKRR